jgi:catechol-2,3-dioxygenase
MASLNIPPPVQIAHVVLRTTTDAFPKMVEFYTTFFGGTVTAQVPGMAFITFDSEHHRIAIFGAPNAKPRDAGTCGLEHIAFTHANLNDLLLAYKGRKSKGLEPVWCVNHGPTLSIYYRDPDGNNLETQIDTMDSIEKINAMITSEEFRDNPVGVDFDPDECWEQLQNGVPYEKLVARQSIGPRGFETVPI